MSCNKPITAWRPLHPDCNGKRALRFGAEHQFPNHEKVEIACGKCLGCRISRQKQWALRCNHEAKLHQDNMFITLTYDDRHMPPDHSVDVKVWQKFMKRLRKHIYPTRCRFFACGEYGKGDELNKLGRPHYHALIFGYRFPDMTVFDSSGQHVLLESKQLQELWPYGYSSIGQVTFESAAYVAQYCTKKINGQMAEEHYQFIDPFTGECFDLNPEFCCMSRRPGIGKGWLEQFSSDLERNGFVYENGKKCPPPRFYQEYIKEFNPESYEKFQCLREKFLLTNYNEYSDTRLSVKEELAQRRLSRKDLTL